MRVIVATLAAITVFVSIFYVGIVVTHLSHWIVPFIIAAYLIPAIIFMAILVGVFDDND